MEDRQLTVHAADSAFAAVLSGRGLGEWNGCKERFGWRDAVRLMPTVGLAPSLLKYRDAGQAAPCCVRKSHWH